MTYLLDVNILIALLDSNHIHHRKTLNWFNKNENLSWATCPITENGLVRIVSHKSYREPNLLPSLIIGLLEKLKNYGKHQFWNDDISITDKTLFKHQNIIHTNQITDTYLLGLAKFYKGKLATLDRKISVTGVKQGKDFVEYV